MTPRTNILAAIVSGGFVAGALDILSAYATFVPRGATVPRIMQFIASGLIGKTALTGGAATVALGYAVHFGLTTIMAAVFVLAALRWPVLRARPWTAGLVFGVLCWLVMNYVALPLSAVPVRTPPAGWAIVSGLLAHCFFVGVPIAFWARYFLGTEKA